MVTKRLVVASLVAVLAAASPAGAIFMGDLKQNTTVNVVVQNSGSDRMAVTVLLINRRDDFAEVAPYTVGAGEAATFPTTIGARIDRMIVLVGPAPGGSATVTVGPAAGVTCDSDCRLEFDTVP